MNQNIQTSKLLSRLLYSFSLETWLSPRKTTMATSKSFSSVASNIWNSLPNHLSSIPTLPAFRRALKHHLFLLVYPDSSAKSGKIKPAQCITLRDTAPTTAIAQPETPCRPSKSVPFERLRLVEVINFAQATYWRMCKSCVTYILTYPTELTSPTKSFSLVQHVDAPTHSAGGILDVVITRSDCDINNSIDDSPTSSDHGIISCTRYEAEIQLLLKRFPNSSLSSLISTGWSRRASHHQKLAPTFPGIDNCLMVTKPDFIEMKASLWLNKRSQYVAKGWSST